MPLMVTPDSPPIKKLVLLMAVSGQMVRSVSVMAPIKLDTATPDNTIVILDAPVFLAIKYTNNVASKAPIKAAIGIKVIYAGNNAIIKVVNKPAPELTPIILGPARALFSTVCSIKPDSDSAQPAKIAARVRGILT